MLITLIELNESCPPFCSFGGLVETPSEITPDDMPRLYAKWYSEWEANNAIEEFCDWLCKNHGCKEVKCGFAMLDSAKEAEKE